LKFSNPTKNKIGHEPKILNITPKELGTNRNVLGIDKKKIHPLDQWQLSIE
jgi:hypothetical protein